MTKRRFELVAGTSRKFWEIEVASSSFTVTFGRIGTAGQTKITRLKDRAAATAAAETLVAEKLHKGYAQAGRNAAKKPTGSSGDEIGKALERAGLGELAARVRADVRAEVWIKAKRSERLTLGQSRIGGAPDLPGGTAWPRQRWTRAETKKWPEQNRRELDEAIAAGTVTIDGHHVALALPFVAQLALADLAPFQKLLPRRGHLWLFADQGTTLGEIDGYPFCASACVFADAARLVRFVPPPTPGPLPALSLAFAKGRSFPDANALELGDDDWQRYTNAIAGLEQAAPRHTCLSRSQYGSIADVPPKGYTTILRVDSDYTFAPPISWGDAAWITFAIPDDALAKRRFDEVRAFRWIG